MHPTPEHIEQTLEQVLLSIQKPGRYVGGEFNSVRKDWRSGDAARGDGVP